MLQGMSDLELLRDGMRRFTDERDWAQFHDPKSLILALVSSLGAEIWSSVLGGSCCDTSSGPVTIED